ncbi:MAG: alanine racemase [Gemmatimonadetes bacterium]|nr:alanine racemase [Gemmatimonadota bacterium]
MTIPTTLARTWLEIDLDRLAANTAAVGRHVGGAERILATVKADAYGHGVVFCARAFVEAGVGWLGVATVEEGVEIRRAGLRAPVLVLSPIGVDEVAASAAHGLSITVSSVVYIEEIARVATQGRIGVHIGIDTGMGREGALPEEASALIRRAYSIPELRVEGVFTHFPSADEGERAFTLGQLERFEAILNTAGVAGEPLLRHAANSAGVLDFPESHLDLVRPGLLLYGLYPSGAVSRTVRVDPVLAFKSRVTHIKRIPAGHPVSYGRRFHAERPTEIACVAVGYADGFSRRLSCERGEVLIDGRRHPVIGSVTMDQILVKLDGDSSVDVGDPVVLIGEDGAESIDVIEMAAIRETIPWDVLTGIGPRVPRIYLREGVRVGARTLLGRRSFEKGAEEDVRDSRA